MGEELTFWGALLRARLLHRDPGVQNRAWHPAGTLLPPPEARTPSVSAPLLLRTHRHREAEPLSRSWWWGAACLTSHALWGGLARDLTMRGPPSTSWGRSASASAPPAPRLGEMQEQQIGGGTESQGQEAGAPPMPSGGSVGTGTLPVTADQLPESTRRSPLTQGSRF